MYAIEGNFHHVRLTAVDKLTDQSMLVKVACEGEDWDGMHSDGRNVCWEAAEKISDLAQLAKAASYELTKIAGDNNPYFFPYPRILKCAAEKLTDQVMLARIALEAPNEEVRHIAAEKLTDARLLARVGGKYADAVSYEQAVAALANSDPAIETIAGNNPDSVSPAIARMKLFLLDPLIGKQIHPLVFEVRIVGIAQHYGAHIVSGERVHFELRREGEILVSKDWESDWPFLTISDMGFRRATVGVGEFLDELFGRLAFTSEDLVALSRSKIVAVRCAAVSRISDQAMLAKFAHEDAALAVRETAGERLKRLAGKN
jgi:hypothetical protein